MTYAELIAAVRALLQINTADADFTAVQDVMVQSAELEIYRDLDPLTAVLRDESMSFTVDNRNLALPATMIIASSFNVITPASAGSADTGKRNPLTLVSMDVLDFLWPDSTGHTVPKLVARKDNSSICVGPWPDQTYRMEFVGTTRPPLLTSVNTTDFLSLNTPDLLIAACMKWGSRYKQNYAGAGGTSGGDPQKGTSWGDEYDRIFKSVDLEELRKRFRSESWTAEQPSPVAGPRT